MRKWLWLLMTLWLGAAMGQEFSPVPEFPKPKRHIVDDGRLFFTEPGRLAAMEARLVALEEKHQFPVYVCIYSALIGSTVPERVQALQDQWVGNDSPGWVAVLETDNRVVALGIHPVKEVTFDGGSALPTPGPLDLTGFEQNSLRAQIVQATQGVDDPTRQAEITVNLLAGGIDKILNARAAPPARNTRMRIAAVTVGLVAATALVGLLAVAWLRRSDARERQRFVFPEITVGTRLGAPYGGGKISSRGFSERQD